MTTKVEKKEELNEVEVLLKDKAQPVIDAARKILEYSRGLDGNVFHTIINPRYQGDLKTIVGMINELQTTIEGFDAE